MKAITISASFSPTDEQLGVGAKSRTFQFPRINVLARREGALTDRLNTWKGYAKAASSLTQIQFPCSNFIGTHRSRSTFRVFGLYVLQKGSSDDEIHIVTDLQPFKEQSVWIVKAENKKELPIYQLH